MGTGGYLEIAQAIGKRLVSRLGELRLGLQLFALGHPGGEEFPLLLDVAVQAVRSLLKQRGSRTRALQLLAGKLSDPVEKARFMREAQRTSSDLLRPPGP